MTGVPSESTLRPGMKRVQSQEFHLSPLPRCPLGPMILGISSVVRIDGSGVASPQSVLSTHGLPQKIVIATILLAIWNFFTKWPSALRRTLCGRYCALAPGAGSRVGTFQRACSEVLRPVPWSEGGV